MATTDEQSGGPAERGAEGESVFGMFGTTRGGWNLDDDFGLTLREDDERTPSTAVSEAEYEITLQQAAGADVPTRRAILLDLAGKVATKQLPELIQRSSRAFDQRLSPALMAVVDALAADHAKSTSLPTEVALRGLARDLVQTWSSSVRFVRSSQFAALFQEKERKPERRAALDEPERLVQLALEVDALSSVVWGSVSSMIANGRETELLDLLKQAPQQNEARQKILMQLATPDRLNALLRTEPIDWQAVDAMIDALGVAAADSLVVKLNSSSIRKERRELLARLAALGADIAPTLVRYLNDERWYVTRNMLQMLREAECAPEPAPVLACLAHTDPRVRREALRLMLKMPRGMPERAIAAGIADADPQCNRIALEAMKTVLPEAAVRELVMRLQPVNPEIPDLPPELRLIAIRTLGNAGSVHALPVLIRYVVAGKTLLGRPKLHERSPEMLAALGGLYRRWREHPQAVAVLEIAAQSKDPLIAAAAQGRGPGAQS